MLRRGPITKIVHPDFFYYKNADRNFAEIFKKENRQQSGFKNGRISIFKKPKQ
jgi:hypothetical protein